MEQTHLTEDTVSQSGWVFADLLLALSVIFLATVSFVPSSPSNIASPSIEPGKIARSDGFAKTYSEISVAQFLSDLESYKVENSLGMSMRVILIQFIGSDSKRENGSGILDALKFSVELQNLELEAFSNTAISLDTSALLKPGEVLVRAVFGVSQKGD